MARIVVAVVLLCGAAEAMKWAQLTDAELLAGAEVVVDGKIVKRADAPGDEDGASVVWVQVTRAVKGPVHDGETIAVRFWSRRRKSSQISKFRAPRSEGFDVGNERLFLLKKTRAADFADLARPDEARQAAWMHAYDEFYDRQIAKMREAAAPR